MASRRPKPKVGAKDNMKLGFFTMPLHPPGSVHADTLDADLDQIVTLDKLGFSEAWVGEHFTSEWENIPAPDLFLAKALGMTENIVLGTGVTCMPNHNPFTIANRIAQLDNMARGRFMWGVGSGGFPGDLEVFGYDFKNGENRAMTREALDCVLGLWEDPKPGRYKSQWWDFTIPETDDYVGVKYHMTPFQNPHPPIGVAGVSPKSETLFLAGERGYIPMSINLVPSNQLPSHWDAVEEGAARTGRTADRADWRIAREVFVADTTEEAREKALAGTMSRDFQDYFFHSFSRYNLFKLMKTNPEMTDEEVTIEYLLDNIWIVGSVDDVTAKIRALHGEVGGFGTLLAMGHEWNPRAEWQHSMELLANEVMPQLADLK
jgi:alkanesulfonate monooxygenase SsuD/methylene tetrahydromethanopterin reductase-like flavin-dependent oxidoreductase (luciferase family)